MSLRGGLVGLAAVLLVVGCAKTVPCPVCYEDAWSREPFPGEAKQHITPLTPEELKANGDILSGAGAISGSAVVPGGKAR